MAGKQTVQQQSARVQDSVLGIGSPDGAYFGHVLSCPHALKTLKHKLKLLLEQEREAVGETVALSLFPKLLPSLRLATTKHITKPTRPATSAALRGPPPTPLGA